ncbi:3-hydroxyacyl-CoA dehydrogenase / enoyl-CoA hydratase / 3-hydroxybutyryl-CoA epimerase [Frankia canadensis]|uniref:3-hydroxyacyl-CoA dehydrogenase / enoyl-CoA hydratase / 3-hydroxybutyryl-CoA epimerase n=1 Tax=Frankia canadensis TaxID=1836972 RepID=A0A2I2KPU7_9ACTN|nr:3-hydroxyacyl-CoA dehydrogenase NAD-binding domain-containing protein [Frankia canadensis]SNQ47666.1 3-hydroxyacyl-CoA dehydrogenase / enoyl-CoA hydratase / 3-hydroxybutyryl-CoA epimerase [Frankia canadensis]SOU54956.1 3-hydroxyacyl-CoA dehydrogenase / enoyl-CoA hydratase / 3-hydroxybutyryl-CoA epimerase [Frankia canadensis]
MTDPPAVIRWDRDADGVVLLTMDDPEQSANTMNERFLDALDTTINRLREAADSITGVVLVSAKKTFLAGGDLRDLAGVGPEDRPAVMDLSTRVKRQLRRLETLSRPVVAAINGAALGGGLELALAAHHRIAVDGPGVRIGLPEVTFGLLPGGGGVVRSVRLLGITDALSNVLLPGQRHAPVEAARLGLVHELVGSADELLPAAKAWISANPHPRQPWDEDGYSIPGGSPADPELTATVAALPAKLRGQLRNVNLPAPRAILAAAVEGAQADLETAFAIESRYFADLVTGQVSKNLIQAFFFDMRYISSGGSRPAGYPTFRASRAAVLGAGMMGAGIAYSCAQAGMEVVLKDVSAESAARGRAYSERLVAAAIGRAAMTPEAGAALLARVNPTADVADLADADLVIEAVFESPGLKGQVFREAEAVVSPDALLASNTSTLPITQLAQAVRRPEDFIGMHFFSPVEKMPLVEIVVGEKTSDATLARALDVVRQLRKTPIVVNDSRGFFTSRVIIAFLQEAVAMVGEGVDPASIEQAGVQAGYPAPPLQLLDELTLTLPRRIREETKAAVLAAGRQWQTHGSEAVIDRMLDQHGRSGRAGGGGFYEYVDGRRDRLWPGLREQITVKRTELSLEDMKERMLFAEALEAVRCLDEGVLRSVAEANIGSLLGIGFPTWTGGVIQYVNGYEGGLPGFVVRARELANRYGDHFQPPLSLVQKSEAGDTYS